MTSHGQSVPPARTPTPHACILAGGKGTRLSALFPDLPKALAPVRNQPFLYWQLGWLRRHGYCHIHLALGFRADQIIDWLTSNPYPDLSITTSVEPQALGTGGAMKFAGEFIGADSFTAINGDTLLPELDLSALRATHEQDGALATLAVTRIEESGRYGTVEFDDHNRLTAFREKSLRTAGWVNGGVYAVSKDLLRQIAPDRMISLEQDTMPHLLPKGLIKVHPAAPPLLDMGTSEGLLAMEHYLAANRHRFLL